MVNRRDQMPIRVGCYVSFVQKFRNGSSRLVEGHVVEDEYDDEGHHLFTIARTHNPNWKTSVTGAMLYTNLLSHEPGERSRIDARRAWKRGIKRKRQRRQKVKDRAKRGW